MSKQEMKWFNYLVKLGVYDPDYDPTKQQEETKRDWFTSVLYAMFTIGGIALLLVILSELLNK